VTVEPVPAGWSLRPAAVVGGLLAAALVTWIVTVERMDGMDAGPGTDLGGFGWFLGVWVTMMAAMMLPSVAPTVALYARASRSSGWGSPWIFAAGYLAAWTVYGAGAYGVYRLVDAVDHGVLAWDRAGPYVAGIAVALAGLYQLTPLKDVCLRHCRSPLHFLLGKWRAGPVGALRMGAGHGLYCVGCCWGLMIVLFAVGVMSVFWMAVIAAVIFAEKLLPLGRQLSYVFAVALVGFGIWIAADPGSVPWLTTPGEMPSMQME
jgi:predicted metal-binding membrane protein